MIDINLIRNQKELVKENIKKKYQDEKLPLVDEVFELDIKLREIKLQGDELRSKRNTLSSEIGKLVREQKANEVEQIKLDVKVINEKLIDLEKEESELEIKIDNIMKVIPNIIADSVPLGKTDADNVEIERFLEPKIPSYEIPYHVDIIQAVNGIDLDTARDKTSGHGFYYLLGDIALLHSAILAYARDYMIEKGFIYVIPPFMIKEEVVSGVMSFEEMDNMMYKIEGEDLYLIGTSEHSMIGMFKDRIIDSKNLPCLYTSYSPCFRKEKGAHGIEERGIYRIHQFEKQEMIVVCHPKDSQDWYDKMLQYTVDFFVSLEIPVRTLECCSGDLADLKNKSADVEAFSPRQNKYFEVGSCSNLTDAQARRLKIRIDEKGEKYYAHTLNNTVVAPPRMLISFVENHYQEDGSIKIPKVLQSYLGGLKEIKRKGV